MSETDNDGRTPLHWAAYKGFTDTVRLLLVLNASVSTKDKEGTIRLERFQRLWQDARLYIGLPFVETLIPSRSFFK